MKNSVFKKQFDEFVADAVARAATFFKTTLGLPEEIFFEEWRELNGVEQSRFLSNLYRKHPKIFIGMKHYQPQTV